MPGGQGLDRKQYGGGMLEHQGSEAGKQRSENVGGGNASIIKAEHPDLNYPVALCF